MDQVKEIVVAHSQANFAHIQENFVAVNAKLDRIMENQQAVNENLIDRIMGQQQQPAYGGGPSPPPPLPRAGPMPPTGDPNLVDTAAGGLSSSSFQFFEHLVKVEESILQNTMALHRKFDGMATVIGRGSSSAGMTRGNSSDGMGNLVDSGAGMNMGQGEFPLSPSKLPFGLSPDPKDQMMQQGSLMPHPDFQQGGPGGPGDQISYLEDSILALRSKLDDMNIVDSMTTMEKNMKAINQNMQWMRTALQTSVQTQKDTTSGGVAKIDAPSSGQGPYTIAVTGASLIIQTANMPSFSQPNTVQVGPGGNRGNQAQNRAQAYPEMGGTDYSNPAYDERSDFQMQQGMQQGNPQMNMQGNQQPMFNNMQRSGSGNSMQRGGSAAGASRARRQAPVSPAFQQQGDW